jgi:hypothetical protein
LVSHPGTTGQSLNEAIDHHSNCSPPLLEWRKSGVAALTFRNPARFRCMKIAPLVAILSLGSLLGACNSLDNPLHGFLNTGNDGRVYNGSTGHYEWPDATPRPKPAVKPADIAAAVKATPTPAKKEDGRAFDPQKGQFVKTDNGQPASAKAKATPSAVVAKVTPIPAPEKGTGVYNMETGKFDWSPSGIPTAGKPSKPPAQETQATPAPAGPLPPAAPLFPQ